MIPWKIEVTGPGQADVFDRQTGREIGWVVRGHDSYWWAYAFDPVAQRSEPLSRWPKRSQAVKQVWELSACNPEKPMAWSGPEE